MNFTERIIEMKKGIFPKIFMAVIVLIIIIMIAVFAYRRYLPHKEEKKTEKGTIVRIGDSLTFGFGVMFNRLKQAWPYLLDEILENYEVLNYGISGSTAFQGSREYSQDFLNQAIALNADIYFYMLGSNDAKNPSLTKDEFKSDTLRIMGRLINGTNGRIIILLPTPVFENSEKKNAFGINKDVVDSVVIESLKEIAEENNLIYLSLYDLFKDKPQYFKDLVHPDKAGNQIIARYIYDNIFSNE